MPIAADEKTRITALTAYAITNSQVQAADVAGVSNMAVSRWVADSPEMLERIRRELQATFMEEMVAIARVLLVKVGEAKTATIATAKDAKDIATAFGIIVDKMCVLLGLANRQEFIFSGTLAAVNVEDRKAQIMEQRRYLEAARAGVVDIVDAEFTPSNSKPSS